MAGQRAGAGQGETWNPADAAHTPCGRVRQGEIAGTGSQLPRIFAARRCASQGAVQYFPVSTL